MKVNYGKGKTEYGPGVDIELTGEEVARAIYTYLEAHDVHVRGAATITVNGELCEEGRVYVDPSGYVISKGVEYLGRGEGKARFMIEEFEKSFQKWKEIYGNNLR